MPDDSILIVDDSMDNLRLTQLLLDLEGYEVHTAQSAAEAIVVLGTIRPDLILMDVEMPEMDGLDLTWWLRRDPKWDAVKIVALTAYAMKRDEEKARATGCDGYITKPIDTRRFADQVREYLFSPREVCSNGTA